MLTSTATYRVSTILDTAHFSGILASITQSSWIDLLLFSLRDTAAREEALLLHLHRLCISEYNSGCCVLCRSMRSLPLKESRVIPLQGNGRPWLFENSSYLLASLPNCLLLCPSIFLPAIQVIHSISQSLPSFVAHRSARVNFHGYI